MTNPGGGRTCRSGPDRPRFCRQSVKRGGDRGPFKEGGGVQKRKNPTRTKRTSSDEKEGCSRTMRNRSVTQDPDVSSAKKRTRYCLSERVEHTAKGRKKPRRRNDSYEAKVRTQRRFDRKRGGFVTGTGGRSLNGRTCCRLPEREQPRSRRPNSVYEESRTRTMTTVTADQKVGVGGTEKVGGRKGKAWGENEDSGQRHLLRWRLRLGDLYTAKENGTLITLRARSEKTGVKRKGNFYGS